MSECATIEYLQRLSSPATPVAHAASASLNIIADVREFEMTATDLKCLHDLVDAIVQEGHGILLSHLLESTPDCAICAALAQRMATHQRRRIQ
jgi:hypothetical protein